jgi:YHS domain-containing protein
MAAEMSVHEKGKNAMVKRLSLVALTVLFFLGAATLFNLEYAQAAGTYKLEYPQGYGVCCPPNVLGFGYSKTKWREWPGEVRLDKTFPRSIGMEKIPTPAGQEIIPAPATPKALFPGRLPPEPGTQGVPSPPLEGQPHEEGPGEKATEPTQELPALPGLPSEPGGFNPLPGLPSDFGEPPPLNLEEKKEDSGTQLQPSNKPDAEPLGKNKSDSSSLDNKSEGRIKIRFPRNSAKLSSMGPSERASQVEMPKIEIMPMLQPVANGELVHGQALFPENHIVQKATHLAPLETAKSAAVPRNIVEQICEQPSNAGGNPAVVQSGFQLDMPPVAWSGFCPVELLCNRSWVQGDPRWTVVYKGYIYRLSGNAQRQEFLANPEKYIPANNGFDPVLWTNQKHNVPGQVNFCASYNGRIYMFSSAATQKEFYNHPEQYSGEARK